MTEAVADAPSQPFSNRNNDWSRRWRSVTAILKPQQ